MLLVLRARDGGAHESCMYAWQTARLAQLVERKALNLVVVGSSPTVGVFWLVFCMYQLSGAVAVFVSVCLSIQQ